MKFVTACAVTLLALVACSSSEEQSASPAAAEQPETPELLEAREFLAQIETDFEARDADRVLSHVHRPWGGSDADDSRFRDSMAAHLESASIVDPLVTVDALKKNEDGTITAALTVRGFQTATLSPTERFKAWVHLYKKNDGTWEVVTASWLLEKDYRR
jgi:hypothetical protein